MAKYSKAWLTKREKDNPGYGQLRWKMLEGKPYIPVWDPVYRAKYGKMRPLPTVKPNSKNHKMVRANWRKIRTISDKKMKKHLQAFAWRLQNYPELKVPAKMVAVLIQDRLDLLKKQKAKRGISGAFKMAQAYAKSLSKDIVKAVKVLGPKVADLIPGAGPIIKSGLKLLGAAEKGVKQAQSAIKDISKQAGLGDLNALKQLNTLKAARVLQKQVRGELPPAPIAVVLDNAKLREAANKRNLVLLNLK